jgi:proliferating cell nuclear antigen PCNA
MKITINDKQKIDIFIAIFQLLKNCSNSVKLDFSPEKLYIQGMDKSHVCLFHIQINSEWFTSYEYSSSQESQIVMLDTTSLHTILSRAQENNTLVIFYGDNNDDQMDIELISNSSNSSNSKGEYNRYFQIPLIDIEQVVLNIPTIDYDAEFSMSSKQLHDLTGQLILFGDVLNIVCNEEGIDLNSSGEHGKMKVTIPMDDLHEFSISEGEQIDLSFSLIYIHKMCLTTKLSKEVEIGISTDYPIRIKYDLGKDSYVIFFVAPKIE